MGEASAPNCDCMIVQSRRIGYNAVRFFSHPSAVPSKQQNREVPNGQKKSYSVTETGEMISIGSDLPDKYANSNYTRILKGANAKAKANAVQGLPEIIQIASGKRHEENRKDKHRKDACYGWYRYESRFALPVYGEYGKTECYNVFDASLLARHAGNRKIYLYDVMNIKKETGRLFQSADLTQ